MRLLPTALDARTTRAIVWVAGAATLAAGAVAWLPGARPYEAPWAWICFIGLCLVDDYLLGSPANASWARIPRIALIATIIMFRRHPEITMLVALVSAPLGSAMKRQPWATQLTATAQWAVPAVLGSAALRAVGFEDMAHFVAATVVLVVIFYALGPLLGSWIEGQLSGRGFGLAFAHQRRFALSLALVGTLLATAWRTPAFQPAALKLADGALVAVVGIIGAVMLGATLPWLFRVGDRIPQRGAIAGGLLLLLGLITPLPFSWLLPLVVAVAAGIWAVSQRAYPVLCCALGAFCNEAVRAANGGYMPVDGSGLMSGVGAANTYITARSDTVLAMLDDRIHLPAPFPGIASAGDILIAIGMAWLVATVVVRRRSLDGESTEEVLTADAAA